MKQEFHDLFYVCVNLLKEGAKLTGLTYEEINIYLFVILHPAITLGLLILLIKKYAKDSSLYK